MQQVIKVVGNVVRYRLLNFWLQSEGAQGYKRFAMLDSKDVVVQKDIFDSFAMDCDLSFFHEPREVKGHSNVAASNPYFVTQASRCYNETLVQGATDVPINGGVIIGSMKGLQVLANSIVRYAKKQLIPSVPSSQWRGG